MAGNKNAQASHHGHDGFPWKHLIGFIISLALTFVAVFIAFETDLSKTAIMSGIIILAVLQALLQLIMFMHVTESESGKVQVVNMAFAFFIAIAVVAGSIWVMSFGMTGM
ncbi:cytochrome aa3 quinol oxidase subunit IV [Priestia koreensis]|uniref:Quinol oxidase subunit 4 n=1 Tax=Priestia koreensis TaxID=284581 RepID=A0A0M0KES7_9BACI|nr:cytochrome aa3 quinol oxidase subunit IV [Priestia koreensis]KOO37346.1 quinol oxidase subunit 4 [Priestia koreensis]MCM3006640.1 cytochrome aa3 quinol oxidase subunit IV [Priestia koreensis]UNL84942.1 cytochrome aa3 quinol oxidase subunit IV [Priestia koreensis]